MAEILMNSLTDDILNAVTKFSKQMVSTGVFAYQSTQKIFNDELDVEFNPIKGNQEAGTVPYVANTDKNESLFSDIGIKVLDAMLTQSFDNSVGIVSRKPTQLNRTIRNFYDNKFGKAEPETIRIANGIVKQAEQSILQSMDADSLLNNILIPAMNGMIKDMRNRSTVAALYSNTEHKIKSRFDNYLRPLATSQLQLSARLLEEHYASAYTSLKWVSYIRRTNQPEERREFCNDHESNFKGNPRTHYHINEVKYLWTNYEGGKWEGQIQGTNKNTILNFAGGYNCLHSFEYTNVQSVKQSDITAARNNLKGSGHSI
jgi:hypothetical protein